MSKKAKHAQDFSAVKPQLVDAVREIVARHKKHTYSVSKIYAAHNAAFGLNENPQTCASCLRVRAEALEVWLGEYEAHANKGGGKDEAPVTPDPGTTDDTVDAAPVETTKGLEVPKGARRFDMGADVMAIDFTAKDAAEELVDGTKGTALNSDGSKLKPGVYETTEGFNISVQVGGKATLRVAEDLT